jgi:CheY-like chemotaxis protein
VSTWNLLFVDDEPNILAALRRQLHDTPYTAYFCDKAEDALDLLRIHQFHVVVSDHQMPTMTGSEFLHRVRLYDERIIRCLFSGYTDMGTMLKAINRGEVFRFMPKPWEDESLFRIIRESIAEYQARLGDSLLHSAIRMVDVPFVVGNELESGITWMNPAARDLLLPHSAALPDSPDIGTSPDAMLWPLKTLVPGADQPINEYLTGRDHPWQGRSGRFRVLQPKGFPDRSCTAWLWMPAPREG